MSKMREVNGKWQYVSAEAPAPIVLAPPKPYTSTTQKELWRVFLEDARNRGGVLVTNEDGVYVPKSVKPIRLSSLFLLAVAIFFFSFLVYQLWRG